MNLRVNNIGKTAITFHGKAGTGYEILPTTSEYDKEYLEGLLEKQYENVSEARNCMDAKVKGTNGFFHTNIGVNMLFDTENLKNNSKSFQFRLSGDNGLRAPGVYELYEKLIKHIKSFK